jgi:putative restriction endonuclease
VHFQGTRPGWYRPSYPCFVVDDDRVLGFVRVVVGKMAGPFDEREPVLVEDPVERRYLFRDTRVRMHQAQFRGRVLPAYADQCAICRLKEPRLLDASHIVGDLEDLGDAVVSNGLALCSIHHRAYDQDLLGISPEYRVRVSRRLLEDEDGPMLELLKGANDASIRVPERRSFRPDPDRLALRFDRFLARSA